MPIPNHTRSSQSPAPVEGRSILERVLALGPPPLLAGESEAEFLAFSKAVVSSAMPADAIEEILVRDVVDLAWEVLRLRRIKAALINVNMHHGLSKVLETVRYGGQENYRLVQELTRAWAAGDKDAQKEVRRVLDMIGSSLAEVAANTIDYRIDSFERLDRMLASAEARRNSALREVDRYRDSLGVGARRALDDVEDVDFQDVETGAVAETGAVLETEDVVEESQPQFRPLTRS